MGKRENVECWERRRMWSVGKEGKCKTLGKREMYRVGKEGNCRALLCEREKCIELGKRENVGRCVGKEGNVRQ